MPRLSAFVSSLPLFLALACSGEPFSTAVGAGGGGSETVEQSQAGKLGIGGAGGVIRPLLGNEDGGASDGAGAGNDVSAAGTAGASAGGHGAVTGSGSTGGVPNAGGGAAVEPGNCPSLGGEKLVRAGSFCIDENEVTVAHYRAFVESKPDVTAQPSVCAWNTTFANGCKATSPEKEPQRCVDWCDARAYCESVGKHLCGSTSSATGALPFDTAATSAESEWYGACSHDGQLAYPYGDEYDGSACWGADKPSNTPITVRSASGCVGGYEGLWDMSGSLAEWVDSCAAENGAADACHIRGGSSGAKAAELRCDWQSGTARNTTSSYIGFRCCADLSP